MPRGEWINVSVRKSLYNKLLELAKQNNLSINDLIEKLLNSPVLNSPVNSQVNERVFKCRGKRHEKMIIMRCIDENGREREAVVPEKILPSLLEKLGEAIILEN
jgi:predicted CopG family antitoxin